MAVPGRSQLGFPPITSVVKKLIIGLLAAYILQLILQVWLEVHWVGLLALTPGVPLLWQLVTYVLVDASGPLMFLIGLVFLWWALSPFELTYGPKRTLQLCAVVLLSAAVPAWLGGLVLPAAPPLFGSAPLWFGGITATTWPQRNRQMSFFGMFQMSGKQFLLLIVGIAVLMFLASRNYTHLIAVLGAMAGGIGFVRWMANPGIGSRVRRAPPRRGFRVIKGGGKGGKGSDRDDDERPKYLN